MNRELIALAAQDADPAVACDRGIPLVPAAERRMHQPDRTLMLVERGSLVARCSCWWSTTPSVQGGRTGVVGHYASADEDAGEALLSAACALLASIGAVTAIGPMDGTTWRRYRFIVDRGVEPAFFLEPDHPDAWPDQWRRAGFEPLSSYTSAVNDTLAFDDPRTPAALERLRAEGITIRQLDAAHAESELKRIFALSMTAFARNFLYTPIGEAEFLAQYQAILPYVRADLVLLAEKGDTLVGFMFALPDLLQARRGVPMDTVVLKTVAVDPALAGMGLGGALMDLVQRRARELGFRRAIHALIHESNASRLISGRSARTFRRYALFSKTLTA
jgi:GNAT superfamily N-acetyltransferase